MSFCDIQTILQCMKMATCIALMVLMGISAMAQKTGKGPAGAKATKMTNEKMKVEVWSDVVCPFCYLGKRRYETALKKFAEANNVELVWKSFQLYPGLQQHVKENSYQHIARMKHISYEQSAQMHEQVVNMAAGDGLHYRFDKTVVANSHDAHRLVQMAKTHGKGSEAEELLFSAYLVEGKDISDKETLAAIGAKIGLDKTAVKKMLEGNDYAAAVQTDQDEATRLGINGVPFFVFNRRYAVSGAQPVDTFLKTMEHAYKEWKGQ
jgi:predicted DsbA family dithiol-disulfide isomerase